MNKKCQDCVGRVQGTVVVMGKTEIFVNRKLSKLYTFSPLVLHLFEWGTGRGQCDFS